MTVTTQLACGDTARTFYLCEPVECGPGLTETHCQSSILTCMCLGLSAEKQHTVFHLTLGVAHIKLSPLANMSLAVEKPASMLWRTTQV